METVGDYKKAGLVFVGGDACDSPIYINTIGYTCSSRFFIDACGDAIVTEFAWRTSTGTKPEFNGVIEYELKSGTWGSCEMSLVEFGGGSIDPLVKWRPHIDKQGSPYDVGAHCSDASKPVYTQEMADAGELPMVGSEYLDEDGQLCLCIGYSSEKGFIIGQMVEHPSSNGYPPISTSEKTCVKPIKTEREKAIGEMVALMDLNAPVISVFEAIYDAGYRLDPNAKNELE